ncbi:DUF1366 domain-containing protein [Streptococcus suis]|uniref:Protein of uncharacterized function (DUF1366) n=4 Tax=Streptococcus suis TaxID=1307 RepID=A0A0Z8IWC7_STRSU|nr:DUF1366 domain-containing protein [Streptococcus suis]MBY4962472.1 DUF1366 domain-containing protein [Streptococcus suis]MBY4969153.1 DUF1366 domain-containing protein [Streptococcus suis]MBY4980207.1 DUF1366 domain-containing protein [Streptococcus suis]MBY4988778.1 DUF1366 domain-containing protein [Streptococcus suis]MBY4995370.1 DUF1366 domain-containing protein [Streptococcus suis]
MRLKFGNKSLEYTQGEHPKTRVLLINDEGAMYPIYFDKEAIDKSDAELFELALEKIYQDNFPNRAEDEKFEFFNKAILEVRKETEKNREIAKTMSLSFTQFVELLEERGIVLDDEETEEVADHETIIENQEQN